MDCCHNFVKVKVSDPLVDDRTVVAAAVHNPDEIFREVWPPWPGLEIVDRWRYSSVSLVGDGIESYLYLDLFFDYLQYHSSQRQHF